MCIFKSTLILRETRMKTEEKLLRKLIREVMAKVDGTESDITSLVLGKLNKSEWFEKLRTGHKAATGEDLTPLKPWAVEKKENIGRVELTVFSTTLDPDESDTVKLNLEISRLPGRSDNEIDEYTVVLTLNHLGRGNVKQGGDSVQLLKNTFRQKGEFMRFIMGMDILKIYIDGLKSAYPTPLTKKQKEDQKKSERDMDLRYQERQRQAGTTYF